VHAEHGAPVLLGAGGEARRAGDAGDVDDRVERAELLDEPTEEAVDRTGVGDRDPRCPGPAARVHDALRRRCLDAGAPG
jgi:hypothetical protein